MYSLPLYLDYNATAPLSDLVQTRLAKGALPFANPSSQHIAGKESRRAINQTIQFLDDFFSLSSLGFRLFFHSGATEGINTVIQGMMRKAQQEKKKFILFSSPLDHACVVEAHDWLVEQGADLKFYPINEKANLIEEEFFEILQNYPASDYLVLVNVTWVHNETGVVWDLKQFEKFKAPHIYLHVDAVQSIGKIPDFQTLNPKLDFYTYSGHKFGALKGIGFTVYKNYLTFPPMLWGGGQQSGLRPGTENILGVLSLRWALEDLIVKFDPLNLKEKHTRLEERLFGILQGKGEILFSQSSRNLNTIYFYLNSLASDLAVAIFDQEGLQISSGSACSSGAAKRSAVMQKVGLDKFSRNALRLSHGFQLDDKEIELILSAFSCVMNKIS